MNFVALVMKKENNLLDFLAELFWRIFFVFVAKVRITMHESNKLCKKCISWA